MEAINQRKKRNTPIKNTLSTQRYTVERTLKSKIKCGIYFTSLQQLLMKIMKTLARSLVLHASGHDRMHKANNTRFVQVKANHRAKKVLLD